MARINLRNTVVTFFDGAGNEVDLWAWTWGHERHQPSRLGQ